MDSKLIIFDLDGTLIDSRADLAAGINHMRGQYDLEPLPFEVISSFIGNGARKLVARAIEGEDVDLDDALKINLDFYRSNLTVHTHLYDGVAEGIPALVNAGHKVSLLTNKPGDPSREILDHFGLRAYFTSVVGGGDVANLKPEPDGILKCAEEAGMELASSWMVGDHYTDLAVAQNAQIKSALVQYGFGDEREYKADQYFASFSELVSYFV